MDRKIFFQRSLRDLFIAAGPSLLIATLAVFIAYRFINPAAPNKVVISTGDGEGDYLTFAKQYRDLLKDDGVDLEIRSSSGAMENLKKLQDPNSDVDVGFVQDGLGSADEDGDLVSLGSLYYEPLWVFYRGATELKTFSQLTGKKIAIGSSGGGTDLLTLHLLKSSGVDAKNASLLNDGMENAAEELRSGRVDVAVFMSRADDPLVSDLITETGIRLMSVDQAEAITKQNPYLHHLVLPHGALDLARNLPERDTDLVAPTATLLVRDSLHPALMFLLLKAASQIHAAPGMFEKSGEFPRDKDDRFPLSEEAKQFYKSGVPFWQRYLPFWLASLLDRFLLVILPLAAVIFPLVRAIPKVYAWRIRNRIYKRYGELKFLETQIRPTDTKAHLNQYLTELDLIEERVNQMKVPIEFAEHLYALRGHIDFVRGRLARSNAS